MKPILKLLLSITVLFIFCETLLAQDFRVIDTKEMKAFVTGKKKVVIVDARTPDEYARGHIPRAINISYEKFPNIEKYLPRDKKVPIVFYCRGYS